MFGTGHPRPLHRREVAMHVVRQQERRLDSHTLTVDVPDTPQAAPPPDPQPIRFDVVYTLAEYLGFVRDHLAFLRRRTGGPLVSAWVALIGTPIFFIKKRRMPRCAFRIDAHGIERTTRAGTLTRSWADIQVVRRYRRGYLVMYDMGAMLIPCRCMDREQEAAFRRLGIERRPNQS
ncbi:YcxB-like protein [Massilia sp. PDC64]|nr:YcxB-like protein [Massilia sp. PDC64]